MIRRTATLLPCALLCACAGPGVPAPETVDSRTAPAEMPERRTAEAEASAKDEVVEPTLEVDDELGMFSRDGTDDPLALRLSLPSGAAELAFDAMPSSDVASARGALASMCIAHAPGTVVGRTRSTIDDDWAEFTYEGFRGGEEVRGTCRVFRLEARSEFTVRMWGEWRPGVDDMMRRRIDAMTPTLRVED